MKILLTTLAALTLLTANAPHARAQWRTTAPPSGAAPAAPPDPAADPAHSPPTPPPASEITPAEAPPVPPPPPPLPPPPPAPPSPIAAAAATEPPPAASAAEGGGPGPVERLPPSAYPEQYTRGLYGGSLWSTFHGVQWPYYARTGIGVSGYGWLDNSFEQIHIGDPAAPSSRVREYLQQGRILVRVTPTYALRDYFVQAQAEIVANKDQSQTQSSIPSVPDADDVWVRIGRWRRWDLMVGRFEAFEIYHRGMGLDINTEERLGAFDGNNQPPDIYGATYLFDRPGRPGNVAAHIYPMPFLRFELLTQYGGLGQYNEIGGRPAVVFDVGWLKLKGAAEYQWLTARNSGNQDERRNRGVAASAQFVWAPFLEGGINYGYASNLVSTPNGNRESTQTGQISSIGAFANARVIEDLLVGAGINYVSTANEHFNSATGYNDFAANTQAFVAVQYLVLKQLFVKLVGAYANSRFERSFATAAPYNDTMYSARLRILYLF